MVHLVLLPHPLPILSHPYVAEELILMSCLSRVCIFGEGGFAVSLKGYYHLYE